MKRYAFARIAASLLLALGSFAVYAQEGGGASSAAPAAAASAPVASAAPATTSTATTSTAATPAAASVSTPATDTSSATTAGSSSAGALTPNPGESDADFLGRVMDAKNAEAEQADSEPSKPSDPEPAPAEETNTEDPAEETGKEETPEDDGYDPYAVPGVLLAPKELAEKINADAALKDALDKNPELKQTLLEQSRSAAENLEFKKVFASADEARVAADGSREYNTLANLVTGIGKAEDAQGFYAHLMQLSTLRDDDGNTVMKDGKPVSDGTVGRLIHHTGELFLNHFAEIAESSKNEDLKAAVEILKDTAFGNQKPSNEHLSDEQKAFAEEKAAWEKQKQETETAAQQARRQEYERGITTGIDTYATGEMEKLLARTDLPAAQRGETLEKIREAAYKLITENTQFEIEQDLLMNVQNPGQKTRDQRIGLARKWLAKALPIVAPKIIAEQGAKIIARQAAQDKRQQERVEASRSEGAGALRTAKPANTSSAADVTAKVISDFTAKHGRAPNSTETLQGIIDARSAK